MKLSPASLIPLCIFALIACGPNESSQQLDLIAYESYVPSSPSAMPPDWHRGTVFMQIYVRAYADSDGDGVGDINGITQKLDYLASLGVRGIWLMPITISTDRNHGYRVLDYRAIDPEYGTELDFRRLLTEAHRRGIGIVLDYLINHSSNQHPIFLESSRGNAKFRNWYLWSSEQLQWKGHRNTVSWHPGEKGFYYGVFSERMPDFNFHNPEVINFHKNNLRYWLNMGVDGFRFDAVSSLIENGPDDWKNQPQNHQIARIFKDMMSKEYDQRFLICELDQAAELFARENSCGSSFALGLNFKMFDAIKVGNATGLTPFFDDYPLENMGIILANHDSFAGDRPIKQLDGNLDQYKALVATQLLLPGRPFIYYGEEIGIGRSVGQKGDSGLRPPMSWSGDGGFSGSDTPFRPYAENLKEMNVAAQDKSPNSLLNYYRKLIQLRNQDRVLRLGDAQLELAGELLIFTRRYLNRKYWVVINYSGQDQTIEFSASELKLLYASDGRERVGQTLSAYQTLVFEKYDNYKK